MQPGKTQKSFLKFPKANAELIPAAGLPNPQTDGSYRDRKCARTMRKKMAGDTRLPAALSCLMQRQNVESISQRI
jgi:hypothetical protein